MVSGCSIRRCSDACAQIRDPLLQASCIGSQFSLTLLSVVSNQSEEDLHRSLIAAVDQAYIFKVSVGQFKARNLIDSYVPCAP